MDSANNTISPENRTRSKFGQQLSDFFTSVYNIHLFIIRFFKEAFLAALRV